MVAGAQSVIGPVVEDDEYTVTVRASDPGGEDGDEDWPEDLPEDLTEGLPEDLPKDLHKDLHKDLLDSASEISSTPEDRGTKIEDRELNKRRDPQSANRAPRSPIRNESRRPGLKKLTKKQIDMDWPPAPRGCEWRRSEEGLNLWRCWTEWDGDKNKRIKKSRYAGHLSDDAWRIMKEYDHEAFISIVGERLRRHGGR